VYTRAQSLWQPLRHWYTPRQHRLLMQALPAWAHGTTAGIDFEGNPQQSAAAFLWQHRVQGRALLPGAAMIEGCYAAACMLAGVSAAGHCMLTAEQDIQVEAPEPMSAVHRR
jgi:hypothetical protein